jgi:hypothetical protein
MVNINMTHVFKHPKFYRIPRDKSDQAISLKAHDGECERAPDPGHKQRDSQVVNQVKLSSQSQASSTKLQAPSFKLSNQPGRASSGKLLSHKHRGQASSHKQQAH